MLFVFSLTAIPSFLPSFLSLVKVSTHSHVTHDALFLRLQAQEEEEEENVIRPATTDYHYYRRRNKASERGERACSLWIDRRPEMNN